MKSGPKQLPVGSSSCHDRLSSVMRQQQQPPPSAQATSELEQSGQGTHYLNENRSMPMGLALGILSFWRMTDSTLLSGFGFFFQPFPESCLSALRGCRITLGSGFGNPPDRLTCSCF